MKQVYYIAGAVILAVITLGIFSSWAQNSDNGADGVLIIEEQDTAVLPVQNGSVPAAVPAAINPITAFWLEIRSDFQPDVVLPQTVPGD